MLVHAATKDVTTAAASLRDIAILHCSQLEHVEQHRHVAAYAVALAGNRDQLVERRVATQRLADGVRRDREARSRQYPPRSGLAERFEIRRAIAGYCAKPPARQSRFARCSEARSSRNPVLQSHPAWC